VPDPEPPPPAEPKVVEPTNIEPKVEPLPRRSWWPPRSHTLILAATAVATGLASLGIGLRAHGIYVDLERRCDDGLCTEAARDDRERGQRLARTSTGLTFAALALGSASALFWVLDVRGERARTQVALTFEDAGCQARLRWEL
jgi:hypothetical protein